MRSIAYTWLPMLVPLGLWLVVMSSIPATALGLRLTSAALIFVGMLLAGTLLRRRRGRVDPAAYGIINAAFLPLLLGGLDVIKALGERWWDWLTVGAVMVVGWLVLMRSLYTREEEVVARGAGGKRNDPS